MTEEWVQILGWTRDDEGWIPRAVLEGMEIDCSPLDSRTSWGRQGTVWFSREQSEKIRKHGRFREGPLDG